MYWKVEVKRMREQDMIKAVIFDLDGVIVDSEPAYKRVDMRILDLLNISMSSSEYDTWMGTSGEEMFAQLKEKYAFPQTVKELTKMQLDFMLEDFRKGGFCAIEGMIDLINTLHTKTDFVLAVASSSPVLYIEEILNSFGISEYFKLKISGENIPRTKPAPDIYLECAKRLGFDPSECIALEDSKNGITAAKKAGMKCIAFLSSKDRNQENDLADYVFDCPEDIKKFLTGSIRYD